jgi:excinuclease ABC subunit C
MTSSVLDDIPGLGPVRRKRLVKEFGSVKELRAAPVEDILAVAWLPNTVGHAVYEKLHAPKKTPSANPLRRD